MPYFICQNEECGHRFFKRSELAAMSGCPVCEEGEVILEDSDWDSVAPARPHRRADRMADARKETERLLQRHKIIEPPVDVERIAYGEGLRVVRKRLEGDGLLEGDVLYVNPDHARTRQRFTIAHEVGHLILHRDGTDEHSEREADAFASALLIPREMLRRAVAETPDLEPLRRRFNVSREALWIALKDARLERKISQTSA